MTVTPTDTVVIWSGQWQLWWRRCTDGLGGCGYTSDIASAGRWTRAEAEAQTRHCGPEKRIKIQDEKRTIAKAKRAGAQMEGGR